MVAYSFQRRFAPAIAAYYKRQTIRGDRKRHAQPGEDLQLFTGMRTAQCRKIIPDPLCTGVAPILIRFTLFGWIEQIWVEDDEIADLDAFAILDGFEGADDMARFWFEQHKVKDGPLRVFTGQLIQWKPKSSAERLAA